MIRANSSKSLKREACKNGISRQRFEDDPLDAVPLPETVEEQTAWNVANILRDLPGGASLSRLCDAYKVVYSRYVGRRKL